MSDDNAGPRRYECEFYSLLAPPRCCLFCDHCTDILWDYTNGPWMFFCDIDGAADPDIDGPKGECEYFEE